MYRKNPASTLNNIHVNGHSAALMAATTIPMSVPTFSEKQGANRRALTLAPSNCPTTQRRKKTGKRSKAKQRKIPKSASSNRFLFQSN